MSISIANRIILGFLAVIGLMLAVNLYAVGQVGAVREASSTIVGRDVALLRKLVAVRDTQRALGELRNAALVAMLTVTAGGGGRSPAEPIAQWKERVGHAQADIADAIALARNLSEIATTPGRASAWRSAAESLEAAAAESRQYGAAGEVQFAAVSRRDVEAALAADPAVTGARDRVLERLAATETSLAEATAAGQARIVAIDEETRLSVLAGIALATLVGLAIAFLIRRSVERPLTAFMTVIERVGHGDLAGEAAAVGGDEIGRLGATLNGMVEGLRQLAGQSRDATASLNAAVSEIRASTQEQAAGVEEQLAAVQETAATVDEITHAGSQIGKRAQEVIVAAQATATTSAEGLRAVEETGRAMDAIREQAQSVAETIVALSEKTQAIGEIISTVNDISERSHLLALNAAIEAAAAGESGRSFAVVAAEMKLLADQAKEATTQVRSILGDIQRGINASVMLTEEAMKRVAAGKERADVTQRTIDEITGRVQEGVHTFQQIVASTNQQQLGIEQVMSALANIRQASQQTAAGTRQLESAAGSLAGMAEQLTALAARYRL